MKTCSTAFLVLAIMITLLTNKCSTKNSLLWWQEILMMFLSVPQPLNQFHGTFHGLEITNWFTKSHGNCLLTRFNFSTEILLATITFLFWILLCYLLNMSSFCIGSIFRCCFVMLRCSASLLMSTIPWYFDCSASFRLYVPPVFRCSAGVPCSGVPGFKVCLKDSIPQG